jgi:hypothetical protein
MVYRDFFVYTQDFWNFCVGFELVEIVVNAVGNGTRSFNFNRYGPFGEGSPNADPDAHITIRFDVSTDEAIRVIKAELEEIKNQGKITSWCSEEDNIWDIEPMSRYSPVYHTAHETSTACAIRFYSELKNNVTELQSFKDNKVNYMCKFLPLWLKNSGFTLLNNSPASSSQFINALVGKCSESFKGTIDKSRLDNKYTFAVRLLHLFFNCITVDRNQEREILQRTNITDLNKLGNSLVDC